MSQTSNPRISIGYQIGRLTVSAPTDQRKNGYTVWRCSCDCGKEILLDTRAIERGTIRDCGCMTKVSPKQVDLTGRRFGMLIALSPTEKRKWGTTVWRCICDCGKVAYVPAKQLLSVYVKSCGCLSHPPLKDFIGRRFGKLYVIAYAGKRSGMHQWKCRCDCGNETIVGQTRLQNGKTKSCGCLKNKAIYDNLKLVDGTSVTRLEAIKRHDKLLSSNTSGFTGVYRQSRTDKWIAQISFKGKVYYLGIFDRKVDAINARLEAEEELFGGFLQTYHAETTSKPLP